MSEKRKYYPHFAVWELTNRCNANCLHCGSSSGKSRINELSREEALHLCEELKELDCKVVGIIGGEFFLSPYWQDVCLKLKGLEIQVALLTNGILLTEKNINILNDIGIKFIAVSIDGIDGTHDYLRGVPGLFEKVLANIRLAQVNGIGIGINTAVSGINIDQIPELYSLFCNLGIKSWQIQCVEDFGRANQNPELQITADKLYTMYKSVLKFQQDQKMKIDIADNIGHFTSLEPYVRTHPFRGCPAGKWNIGIEADGKIRGCLSIRNDENVVGDIRQRSLKEIWEDSETFKIFRERTPDKLTGFCKECEFAHICLAGCSSLAYSLTNTFLENPMCLRKYEVEMGISPESLT